jgi:hypothetical protein
MRAGFHHGLADMEHPTALYRHSSGNTLVRRAVELVGFLAISVAPTEFGRSLVQHNSTAGCFDPTVISNLEGVEARTEEPRHIEGKAAAVEVVRTWLVRADSEHLCFGRGPDLDGATGQYCKEGCHSYVLPLTSFGLFLILVVIIIQHLLEFSFEFLEKRHFGLPGVLCLEGSNVQMEKVRKR